MFPGANAHVYRNEAGEPTGWDYPSQDDPYDPDDLLPDYPDDEDLDGWDDDAEPAEGPRCSICDGLGHGYPGGGPCPLEVTDYSGEPDWAM